MSYGKIYRSVIPGRKGARLTPEAWSKLPTIQVNGKSYPRGGLVPVEKQKVKEPTAAKEAKTFNFGKAEADVVRRKILNRDLKGLTAGVCKAFAEFEGITPKEELDHRGWMKLVSDHVKENSEEKKEVQKVNK